MIDVLSDFLYLIKVDFYTPGLKFGAAFFLILIPSIIYISSLVYFYLRYKESRRKAIADRVDESADTVISSGPNFILNGELKLLVYWAIIGPAISFFYPITKNFVFLAPEKLELFFELSVIEFLLESLPQLIIQGANNSLSDSWNTLTKFSYAISIMSVIRGSFIFATTIYRKQYTTFLVRIEARIVAQVYQNIKNGQDFHGLNDLTLRNLIEVKFYEKFDNKKFLFKSDHMAHLDNYRDLHEKIEEELKNSYNQNYQYEFQSYSFFSRCIHPVNILIFIEFILMFIIWFCNILYIIIADFQNESVRYVNLFFVGLAYTLSIFGSFKSEQMAAFSKVILLKMCTVSHFDQLVSLLYNKEIHTEKGILSETILLVFGWVPIITIQAVNNEKTGNSDGIYSGVIVLNSFWIIMSCFRIFHRLYVEVYKKEERNVHAADSY